MLSVLRAFPISRLAFSSMRAFSALKYTKDHEWLQSVGPKQYKLGITNYAQGELGELVHLDLPEVGKKFKKGESVCVIESVKVAADVYTPLDCEVTTVNKEAGENPQLINQKAEETWIVQVKIPEDGTVASLMSKDQYSEYLKTVKKH